ncbi:hypothetical protein FJZ26_04675 [Candidatus Parvarchaeota archaeon]|nr:hypothetical protein [Candidatus Parvarchaeota archaeon]
MKLNVAQPDPQLGRTIETLPIYRGGFDCAGEIAICENGLSIRHMDDRIKSPFGFVKSMDRMESLPLGRVKANLHVFDQLGGNFDLVFEISDMNYEKLKKACGK